MNKTLKELVIKEATNLKKNAYKTELKKLDITWLDANHPEKCIYGQMTGDCFNSRANNLIFKCAERVYNVTTQSTQLLQKAKLNGPPHKIGSLLNRQDIYFSPIEKGLTQMTIKQKKELIDFLQDKTSKLWS